MKRILLFGWCLPQTPKDGASHFMRNLLEFYRGLGHYVEVFTIARPAKVTFLDSAVSGSLQSITYEGVKYNILIRDWGLLYTAPADPLRGARESESARIWLEYLRNNEQWDLIHFNDVSPLELIELSRPHTSRIRYSFHNFYLLYPIEHLFSQMLFKEDPFRDLTIYELTGQRAVEEYKAMGTLNGVGPKESRELARKFEERIQYGRYVLREVIDEAIGASYPYVIFVRELFKAAFSNITLTDFAISSDDGRSNGALDGFRGKLERAEYANKRFSEKLRKKSKMIFGVYANLSRYKGHHIILKAAEYLSDARDRFEIRFYGHTDFDPPYFAFLQKMVADSSLLRTHVKFMGGYRLSELPDITSDTLVSIGCSATTLGSSGGIYETLLEGNLPLFVNDFTLSREREMIRTNCDPSDIESLRLSYPCGDAEELAALMRRLLDGSAPFDVQFERALLITLTGMTSAPNFRKSWEI